MSTLAEKISIMQAAEEGADIEYCCQGSDCWVGIDCLLWNWAKFKYRIKPQAKELWVNEYPSDISQPCAHTSKLDAETFARHGVLRMAVHYKEVIE